MSPTISTSKQSDLDNLEWKKPDTKVCTRCGEEKLREDFYPRKKGSHLVQSTCKTCSLKVSKQDHIRFRKERNDKSNRWRKNNLEKAREVSRRSKLKRNYGITDEQYEEMLNAQSGRCLICEEECQTGRRLAVDHCHTTGKVRGLLCAMCNKALGGFKDSPTLLHRAIEYLRE